MEQLRGDDLGGLGVRIMVIIVLSVGTFGVCTAIALL
jgi:hypothetical protein